MVQNVSDIILESIFGTGYTTNAYQATSDTINYKLGYHTGVDYVVADGLIKAATAGTVTDTGYNKSYGNYVVVKDSNNYSHWYSHLDKIRVAKGVKVYQGDVLGSEGSTGKSTGKHLHYEVRSGDTLQSNIDPLKYIAGFSQNATDISRKSKKKTEEVKQDDDSNIIVKFFTGIFDFFGLQFTKDNFYVFMFQFLALAIAALLIYGVVYEGLLKGGINQ